MKLSALLRHGLLTLSVGLAAGPSLASDDCDAPVQRWQSREAVRQMAAARGWQVQRLKIDDGCYEIRGTDAEGRTFKATIDPQTLKIVKIKHKDRERDRDGLRDLDAPNREPARPSGASAPSSRVLPLEAPRGQVKQ
jgi:hypothetical protein